MRRETVGRVAAILAAMELVIGGAIALIGSVIVQAFVIPRVSRRTRAIDRWEQDVLLLGDLVSDELSAASAKAFRAWTSWRVLRDRPADTFFAREQIKEMRPKTESAPNRFARRGASTSDLRTSDRIGLRSESRVEIGGTFPTWRSSTQSPSSEGFQLRS